MDNYNIYNGWPSYRLQKEYVVGLSEVDPYGSGSDGQQENRRRRVVGERLLYNNPKKPEKHAVRVAHFMFRRFS